MKTQPKVSILIPIYNVEQYLKQCLDSVVSQTLKDIEIILLDDGSKDNCPRIIDEYAAKDNRIKVVHKPNSGYGATMNIGLRMANGEYIGILESDDWAEPDMYEKLYTYAKKADTDVVKSNFYYYWSKPNKKDELAKVMPQEDLHQVFYPKEKQGIFYAPPSIWAAIYRNKFIKENQISFLETAGASYQDTSFNFKIWACAQKVYLTDEAFLHYRQDNEQSSVKNKAKTFCVCNEYEEIEHFVKERNLTQMLPLVHRLKYATYMWNYERLEWPENLRFLLRMSKEYRIAKKNKLLEYTLFGYQYNVLRRIIKHPIKYFIKNKSKKHVLRQKIQPELSVVIPVYNSEKYLKRCLDSIINQTFKDIEIICVNDGSTDNSLEILKEYAQKDNRIRIFSQKNKGLGATRNTGIKHAYGKYIAFIDSDDELELCAYENALAQFGDDVDCVCFGIDVLGNKDEKRQKADEAYYAIKFENKQKINHEIIMTTDVSACNKIFKLSILRKYNIHFPAGLRFEDACFYFQYMAVAQNAYFIKDKYYKYYRHERSIMAETFLGSDKAIDHIHILKPIYKFYKRNHLFEQHKNLFIREFEACYWLCRNFIPANKKRLLNKQVKKYIKKWNLNKLYPDNGFIYDRKPLQNFGETLFSVKNSRDKKHKTLTVLGISMKFKRR